MLIKDDISSSSKQKNMSISYYQASVLWYHIPSGQFLKENILFGKSIVLNPYFIDDSIENKP